MDEFSNRKDQYREQYKQTFDGMITTHLKK
jgi:hypothetical protein